MSSDSFTRENEESSFASHRQALLSSPQAAKPRSGLLLSLNFSVESKEGRQKRVEYNSLESTERSRPTPDSVEGRYFDLKQKSFTAKMHENKGVVQSDEEYLPVDYTQALEEFMINSQKQDNLEIGLGTIKELESEEDDENRRGSKIESTEAKSKFKWLLNSPPLLDIDEKLPQEKILPQSILPVQDLPNEDNISIDSSSWAGSVNDGELSDDDSHPGKKRTTSKDSSFTLDESNVNEQCIVKVKPCRIHPTNPFKKIWDNLIAILIVTKSLSFRSMW